MKSHELLALDTNVFIYYFRDDTQFGSSARKVFDQLSQNKVYALTSIVTQIELLSLRTLSPDDLENLTQLLSETPNLHVAPLTTEVAFETARIRREYGFRIADAIQLATAVCEQATVFITNDQRLAKFKEVKIKLL